MHRRQPTLSFLLVMMCAIHVQACLWDLDTLKLERLRFPGAHEVIVGKFRRHSSEYYQWRVNDRRQRLSLKPTPELFNDLAVAYDKLGRHQEAIDTIEQKGALFPAENRYESQANLGTFYIHGGMLDQGLLHIRNAIEINPDAHFGREMVQQWLVEYLLQKEQGGEWQLPLTTDRSGDQPEGFARFVLDRVRHSATVEEPEAERVEQVQIANAVKGVLGMMRFGDFESPILLEALGDLLLARGYPKDSKQLATRAFLRASHVSKDVHTSASYREIARTALHMQTPHPTSYAQQSLEVIEKQLSREVDEAKQFFDEIRGNELKWIAEGKDVDAEFEAKYFREPGLTVTATSVVSRRMPGTSILVGGALATVLSGAILYLYRRRIQTTP